MILVDANILVYAYVQGMPQHDAAKAWLDGMLNTFTRVGLPWQSLTAFMRLVSSPRLFERPEPVDKAFNQVKAWLSLDNVFVPTPTNSHSEVFAKMIAFASEANLIPDAHLAALCVEHGLIMYSADGDMARFKGLKWVNPLTIYKTSRGP
ncbi:MAG TPA: type II toxin-antitoxin system VapC family toxin [Myxococcota bacterium]|nr:type II toxin-antitoxin system VapC family toxin [Myxococcota bacterium]